MPATADPPEKKKKPADKTEFRKGKDQIFHRSLPIENVERTREEDGSPASYTFRLSSETPVEFWSNEFEVLEHSAKAVRMDWIGSGNAPALWMHDRRSPVGIIESARIVKKSLEVTVRFGSSELAESTRKDVEAGIIKNVSVGYRIHSWNLESSEDGVDTYRVTDWEPQEGSFVTIPADKTVGVGRSESLRCLLSGATAENEEEPQRSQEPKPRTMPATTTDEKPPRIDEGELRSAGAKEERERAAGINQICERTKGYDLEKLRTEALENGTSLEVFRSSVLDEIQRQAPKLNQADMGVSQKDAKRYSIAKVMEGLRNGNLAQVATHELEVSEEIKRRSGKGGDTVAIPIDVALRGWIPKNERALQAFAATLGVSTRDLQSVTLTGAGQSSTVSNIVETELLDELFVYSLREESALLEAGVTIIPGLVGNVEIPVELLNPEFYWVGEDEEPTEGQYGLGKVGLNFHTLAGQIPFTRQADKQSVPGIENLLIRSCRKGASLGLAKALYSGTGVGDVPRGILNTAGIGDVVAGGAYSRNVLIDLEVALGNSNVTGESASFTNTTAAGGFAKTPVSADSDRFLGKYARGRRKLLETEIGDIHIDNLVPANTIIHGVPSSLLVGMWGAMELGVDTATKAPTGGKVIRVFLDADCVVPQPANWAVCDDLVI